MRYLTTSDIGGFVRIGELPIGATFAHHSCIDSKWLVTDQTPDGVIGQLGARRMLLNPSRLVRLIALPAAPAEAKAGCSVHGSAHDDTDERDCGGTPPPPAEAEALKALVLQYGLHSIEFGTSGVPWGSVSSKVRAGLAGEIDDAIDAVFRERDEWERRAESLLHDVEEYTRLRDAELVHANACRTKRERACDAQTTENDRLETENAALVFRCADVAQEEAHKWEGSTLSASESDSDYDLKNEQWARSHAEVARRIEHKIRSFAPKAEAAIAAAMAREEKS
jgi:hypothetical protein